MCARHSLASSGSAGLCHRAIRGGIDNPYPESLPLVSLSYSLTSDSNIFLSATAVTLTTVPASTREVFVLSDKIICERLLRALASKPGSRIVSHDFSMEGIKPDKAVTLTSEHDNTEHTIYLWTTPLRKEPKASSIE